MTRLENFAISTLSHSLHICTLLTEIWCKAVFETTTSVCSEDHNKDFDDDLLPGECESTWRYSFLRLSAFLHEVPKKIRSPQVLFQIITFYGRVLRSIILRWASEGRKLFGCNNRLFKQYVSLQIAYDSLFELSRFGDLCVWNSMEFRRRSKGMSW